MNPKFGQLVRINNKSPYFKGKLARVAYVGYKGISVYLEEGDFDECIPLDDGEYDVEVEKEAAQ